MKKEKYDYTPIEKILEPLVRFIGEDNKEIVRDALLLSYMTGRGDEMKTSLEALKKR